MAHGHAYAMDHDGGYANFAPPPPPPPPAHIPGQIPASAQYMPMSAPRSHPLPHPNYDHLPAKQAHYYPPHASSSSRPPSMHGGLRERPKSQTLWPGPGQEADKMSRHNLKAFQQQQPKGKKYVGLDGEYEVVGVV